MDLESGMKSAFASRLDGSAFAAAKPSAITSITFTTFAALNTHPARRMERNQVIGFALIFLILIGWSYFTQPSPEEIAQMKEKARLEKLPHNSSTIGILKRALEPDGFKSDDSLLDGYKEEIRNTSPISKGILNTIFR